MSLLVEFIICTRINHKIKNCGGALIIIFKYNTEKHTVVAEMCVYIYILNNASVSTIHHEKWLFIHASS